MAVWCHVESIKSAIPAVSIGLISGYDLLGSTLADRSMVRKGVSGVRTMLAELVTGDKGPYLSSLARR